MITGSASETPKPKPEKPAEICSGHDVIPDQISGEASPPRPVGFTICELDDFNICSRIDGLQNKLKISLIQLHRGEDACARMTFESQDRQKIDDDPHQ